MTDLSISLNKLTDSIQQSNALKLAQQRQQELYNQLIQTEREVYSKSFEAFCKAAWEHYLPGRELKWNWHMSQMCHVLQLIADGEITGWVIINVPPRSSKSSIVSVLFPAFIWTHAPQRQIVTFSHSERFSIRDAVHTRALLQSDWYQQRWGDVFQFADDQNQKHRYTNTSRGHRIAFGLRQNITGEGGDCLTGDTMIPTTNGDKPLKDIVIGDQVLAYCLTTNKAVYSPVVATMYKGVQDIWELIIDGQTASRIRGTADHRVFSKTRNAYIPLRDLRIGEEVCTIRSTPHLYNTLRTVWNNVQTPQLQQSVLWADLPKCMAQSDDDGECKFKLQRGRFGRIKVPLCRTVYAYPLPYIKSGWAVLRNLWGYVQSGTSRTKQFTCAPFRQKTIKQPSEQFNYFMPDVPYNLAQKEVRTGKVSMVRAVRGKQERVYDIQVARHHNFFAGNVLKTLVKNCLIIDDPLDAKDVFSDQRRQTILDSIDQTIPTRLNDMNTGVKLMIMQRIHEDDPAGHILNMFGEDVVHLNIPMRYEGEQFTCKALGLLDPRTEIGEILDTNRFSEKNVKALETALGEYGAASQLQQRPAPIGGGLIKRKWWTSWVDEDGNVRELPEFDEIIISIDGAYTEREVGKNEAFDPKRSQSAIEAWGTFKQGRIECLMLIDAWMDWVDYPTFKRKVYEFIRKHNPDAVVIEKKASGISLVQDLRRAQIPIVPYNPDRSKIARVYACQPAFEAGLIYYYPSPINSDVIHQFTQFPKAKLNDAVDAGTIAILRFVRSRLIVGDMGADYEDDDDGDANNNSGSVYNEYIEDEKAFW